MAFSNCVRIQKAVVSFTSSSSTLTTPIALSLSSASRDASQAPIRQSEWQKLNTGTKVLTHALVGSLLRPEWLIPESNISYLLTTLREHIIYYCSVLITKRV
ncbi:hypothetical protein RRG08_027765 [Elysia crispata]|uniref:Uncharacterized protein n=1 Tax=Elysia crispata TaxID=231223 RepID=A0AAE0Z940_9GAST|nr:hypothetical protein RRG08_027765 [Elysia crispata]